MSQVKQTCSVTSGSATVVIPGVNLTSRIHQNSIFMVVGVLTPYTVAIDSTFDGSNTIVTLTGNYVGTTNPSQACVFVVDFTYPDNLPLLSQGDVGTAAIYNASMHALQIMMTDASPTGFAQNAANVAIVTAAVATIAADMASATTASTTATTEATSATNSATAASGSATAAATSATSSATSATNAAGSATAAATSATALTAGLASFNARWLGSQATNPTLDLNGAPVAVGAEYWNSTNQILMIYTATGWQANDAAAVAQNTAATLSATQAAASASSAATSATTATNEAATAATEAGIATTQATNAATSATSAANSATTATSEAGVATAQAGVATAQATNASGSATAAAGSANSAASSATTATNQATTATNQAAIATSEASTATTQATTATTQATNAAGSATAAAASATNASGSATSAAGSASAAGSSAVNAAVSATTATTQATSSATSAMSAAQSAAQAAESAQQATVGQINSDWNATSGTAEILNKPTFATVATSGSYTDLTNTPTVTAAGIGLGNVNNTSDANKPVSTAQAAADAVVLASAEAYANSIVVGMWNDCGSFNASVNTYPTTGGTGTSGAIVRGDIWTIGTVATAGPLNGDAIGTTVRALANAPGQTAANWAVAEVGLGYVPYNSTNPAGYITSTANITGTSSNITGIAAPANGGTGVNNGSNTLTVGGNIAFNGAFATNITATGPTNVTLPTSGTLLSTASAIGTFPTLNQSTTGNAATATNMPWSGLTGTVPTFNQSTTGNAATATLASGLVASAILTTPTLAVTPATSDNSLSVADTAFVKAAITSALSNVTTTWTYVNAATVTAAGGTYMAVAGGAYDIDTSTGPVTITLPTLTANQTVAWRDYAGTFANPTGNATIALNGNKVNGSTVNLISDINYETRQLTWTDANVGCLIA